MPSKNVRTFQKHKKSNWKTIEQFTVTKIENFVVLKIGCFAKFRKFLFSGNSHFLMSFVSYKVINNSLSSSDKMKSKFASYDIYAVIHDLKKLVGELVIYPFLSCSTRPFTFMYLV